jgi:hypothetical protein
MSTSVRIYAKVFLLVASDAKIIVKGIQAISCSLVPYLRIYILLKIVVSNSPYTASNVHKPVRLPWLTLRNVGLLTPTYIPQEEPG